jgi:hypothetical protein
MIEAAFSQHLCGKDIGRSRRSELQKRISKQAVTLYKAHSILSPSGDFPSDFPTRLNQVHLSFLLLFFFLPRTEFGPRSKAVDPETEAVCTRPTMRSKGSGTQ